jgi:hypothetical protein
MMVGHKLNTKYHMRKPESRIELEIIEEDKDLGVFARSDLKSSTQCLKSAAKARKIVVMIRQNFRRLDNGDFLLLYKTYVRPHLEYCVQSWSPHTHGHVEVLERVQRAATNLIPQLKNYSYEEQLKRTGIPTMKLGRARGDMIEMYKILSGKENMNSDQFFKKSENLHGLRGHTKKITVKIGYKKTFLQSESGKPMEQTKPKSSGCCNPSNGFKNALDDELNDMNARS